jgi:hypothetical protein
MKLATSYQAQMGAHLPTPPSWSIAVSNASPKIFFDQRLSENVSNASPKMVFRRYRKLSGII